ncbi:MAG: oligosaccharide flippase family protein [Leptolyngbyaceae cyanobacterium bins.59]|nr:oligosaccharide flippase family protein [Leptolyngbyaceae cyanobacterium bins.59]
MKGQTSLKQKLLKGGLYLAVRQLIGSALSLISILVIARVLGPENYGIVTIATGILLFTIWTGKLGLDVYLIRQPDLPPDSAEQILAFYNTVGVGLCGILWLAVPLFELWTGQAIVVQVLRWLIPVIWLEMVASASISMMERELHFDQVGLIETIAQAANYLLAIPLVLANFSYWGPIYGWILQYALLMFMGRRCYPVRWRWRWRWNFIREALRCGLAYSGSNLIVSLKALTLPLFVSRFAGLEAAGIIGIATRLADQLGLFRLVISRLSISAIAKLIGNPEATRRAVSQGIVYQGLIVGPPFALFACCAIWVIPLVFGEQWLPSVPIFTLIAVARLIDSVFNLHIATLYAAGHNREVAKFNAWYVGLFWVATWLLLPPLGAWGYGLSEIFSLLSYTFVHGSLARLSGSPDYQDGIWLVVATLPPLLAGPWVSPLISLPLFIGSYGLLFLMRSSIRKIPLELYAVWQSRKVVST